MRQFNILLLLVFTACGQQTNKHSVDSDARQLNDSAVALTMKSFDSLAYVQAISLLDQAIAIDSNYRNAYWNKLSFQSQLKQYDKALQTAKHLNRLFPDAPESYFTLGLLYHRLGDSVSSTKSFKEALVRYDRILDTMSAKNNQYIFTIFNRAANLIVVGRQDEGNKILEQLNDTLTNSLHRQTIEMFMNKSRQEILEGFNQTDSETPKIDLADLESVKSAMTGQWFRITKRDTIVDNFTFAKNSFDGECTSKQHISTAPIFTLIRQDSKTVIRWHELTGGDDFDYVILKLTATKMTAQYKNDKIREYFKK